MKKQKVTQQNSCLERPGMREETQQPANRCVKDSGFKAGFLQQQEYKVELCSSVSH